MAIVAILIPIYNRLETTKKGLVTLFESLALVTNTNSGIQFEVVIIDDGSTDGSAEWIGLNYPNVHIVSGDGSLWWSGSINHGARYSIDVLLADYLLLWNDDILPEQDYFQKLCNMIEEKNSLDTVVGSKVLFMSDKSTIWSNGGQFNSLSGKYTNITASFKDQSKWHDCDWLPGMGTLVPTKVVVEKELWWDDVNFPHYHGDSDFTLRCRKSGVKVSVNDNLVIYNDISSSGAVTKRDLSQLRTGLTSIKSSMNLKKNIRFYSRHGVFPFAYIGLGVKYVFYVGSFFKYTLLQRISKN